MTFQTKDLSVLAHANGFTLWHYRTEDTSFGPDYFERAKYWAPATCMLHVGDMILVNTGIGDVGIPSGSLQLVIKTTELEVVLQPLTQG